MDDWEDYVDDWYDEDIIWCYARHAKHKGLGRNCKLLYISASRKIKLRNGNKPA